MIVECAKLAYADREAWYGDPRFADVPLNTLLSPAYERRAASWWAGMRRWSCGRAPWTAARPGWIATQLRAPICCPARRAPGSPPLHGLVSIGADTCHIDVIDRDGNMVSATPSGGWLQSSPVIPELGFPMGTRGQMFWLKPDCRTAWCRASGRAPRCRPASHCARASRGWRSARPAGISRTSGR